MIMSGFVVENTLVSQKPSRNRCINKFKITWNVEHHFLIGHAQITIRSTGFPDLAKPSTAFAIQWKKFNQRPKYRRVTKKQKLSENADDEGKRLGLTPKTASGTARVSTPNDCIVVKSRKA